MTALAGGCSHPSSMQSCSSAGAVGGPWLGGGNSPGMRQAPKPTTCQETEEQKVGEGGRGTGAGLQELHLLAVVCCCEENPTKGNHKTSNGN